MVDFPLTLDDYTLTVNGCATETKIVFHSATKEVLRRLVYQSGYAADRPRWVWNPGETVDARLGLVNNGPGRYERALNVELLTDQERPVLQRVVPAALPARTRGDVPIHLETKGLAQGVYILRWSSPEPADGIRGQALVTLADTAPLAKAREGEFLYGIDAGSMYYEPNILDWCDWCGIDVVRSAARNSIFRNGVTERDFADTDAALQALERRGMKANILLSPNVPWDRDPAKNDALIAREAANAGLLAARFQGRFLWYEYGNEPNLQPFFFHGPPEDYARLFVAVRDAIKAAYPGAFVTNGGWPFAGAAGAEQRAREMARLIPADKIDGWAYHGHGDGAKAERLWYTLARSAANYPDKINKPFYETESGATATDPLSWRTQARTLVQKLAYAQSVHDIPCFLWFGFHPNWEWGILQNFEEAKPAALAYHVVVQRLRGLRARDRLDLAGAPGEAYWFTAGDGRLAVVLWSDTGEYTRLFQPGAGAADVRRYDLFGNATPLTPNPDGTVSVQVGLDPIYLCAKRPPGAPAPRVLPPALEVPALVRLVPGAPGTLPVVVHNHGAGPLSGGVEITAAGGAPVAATRGAVSVPPGGSATVEVPVRALDVPASWWPRGWVVFAPVADEVDLSKFTAIPATLPSEGKALAAQVGIPQGTHLNLAPLGGGQRERRQAVCFARVDAPEDMDAVLVDLKDANGAPLDHETVRAEVLRPLEARDDTPWERTVPDAQLGAVNNLFKAAPDATHWYHGKADLSGRFWYRAQADGSLLIEAAVADDVDRPGDALHVEVATGEGWKKRVRLSSGQPGVTRRRDEPAGTTWYEAVLRRESLGVAARQAIAIQVSVDDDDWGTLKQTAATAAGPDPDGWTQTWFAR